MKPPPPARPPEDASARVRAARLVSPRTLTLAGILILAAAVRFWGLRFGLPLLQARPDEQFISDKVIRLFRFGPNPHFFDYPSLYLYVLAACYYGLYVWGRMVGWFQTFPQFVSSWNAAWVPFFLIGRVVGAIAGTVSVWLLYDAARRLIGRRAALAAAFFLSVAFLHVRDSHYATTDVPMTCLTLAAMVFIVRLQATTRIRDGIMAGLFAGLATATKYNAAMLGVPMLVGALIHAWDGRARLWTAMRETRLIWMMAAMAAGFFVASPYVILDYGQFLHDMKWLRWSMEQGMTPPELLGIGWTYHARVSLRYGLGLPLYVASLLGIVLLFVRRPRAALLWCSFPVAFYVLTGWSYNVFVRYMVPLVPFLCLTAAYLVDQGGELVTRLTAGRRKALAPAAVVVLAVVLAVPSGMSVVAFDRLLTERDTRLAAADWASVQIPPGSTVYQAESGYGHVQFAGPVRYRFWKWDYAASKFRNNDDRWTDDWPDWIIVHQSPLPYSHPPERVLQRVTTDYVLAHVEIALDPDEAGNVYDIQDAFFVPYAGFKGVHRPGPNITIYRRKQ